MTTNINNRNNKVRENGRKRGIKWKMAILVGLVLMFAGVMTGCTNNQQAPVTMNIDIQDGKTIRTGTEIYTYQVEDGQTGILSVCIARESGRLDLDIYPTGGEKKPEYTGRDMDNTSFDVFLKNAGEYTVRFTADQFIGEYGIKWKTKEGNGRQ